ncbi:MAG TPA: DNA-binding response regulator, partial [Lachnospiraceae bacterium]|nr:DNA-binding response regulator [Lachnospiraceae bacterium]
MIYFVDDDDSIRELIIYTLNSQGIEAEGFAKPSEFWKAMEERIPTLILLDIMLPEEDGISILKKIRSKSLWKKIPVIMLTAKGSEFDTVLGLDSGADDYVPKPFRMMELLSRIRAHLRRNDEVVEENKVLKLGILSVDSQKHIV